MKGNGPQDNSGRTTKQKPSNSSQTERVQDRSQEVRKKPESITFPPYYHQQACSIEKLLSGRGNKLHGETGKARLETIEGLDVTFRGNYINGLKEDLGEAVLEA